jgi:hypothetical protein
MADTGQLSTTSWQLQSARHSSEITTDFPSSILNTFGQRDSQVPQPMQRSLFTFAFDINLLFTNYEINELRKILNFFRIFVFSINFVFRNMLKYY